MKPITITSTAPARQYRVRESSWRPTAQEYVDVGLDDATLEGDNWPTGADEKLQRLESHRFAKLVKDRLVVIKCDEGGFEWWDPAALLRAQISGDEFHPSVHEYRIHSRAQLTTLLRRDIAAIERLLAKI